MRRRAETTNPVLEGIRFDGDDDDMATDLSAEGGSDYHDLAGQRIRGGRSGGRQGQRLGLERGYRSRVGSDPGPSLVEDMLALNLAEDMIGGEGLAGEEAAGGGRLGMGIGMGIGMAIGVGRSRSVARVPVGGRMAEGGFGMGLGSGLASREGGRALSVLHPGNNAGIKHTASLAHDPSDPGNNGATIIGITASGTPLRRPAGDRRNSKGSVPGQGQGQGQGSISAGSLR